jgi:two-component system phosphate regulon sensor histidine kinase PhoR
MQEPLAGLLVIILAVAGIWGLLVVIVAPLAELAQQLRRISEGDFRPVLLAGMPPFFRRIAMDLRRTAELLARQQALLVEEEFSLSIILESMTEGVVITGPDLKIRMLNKAVSTMFGLRGNISGLLLQEVFVSHELHGIAVRASETAKVQHAELTLGLPGRGERCHLLVTAVSLLAPNHKVADGILLVFHDVTRLRELEAVRREFVANVSHEFRTPLSIINGYLETMEDGDLDAEMLTRAIPVMRRHCDRLNRLIEDLLTVSRMEEKGVMLEKFPVEVPELLRGVIGQMEREIMERGVEVRLEIRDPLPRVSIDSYRIEQVFSNLLANALRHGLRPANPKASVVEISTRIDGGDLAVSFRDYGPGIPLKDQKHLFDRFYRVGGDRARQTGGTGLGLSIVKNIVTAHGGRVELESAPGSGSTFTVFLPLNSDA